MSNNLQSQSQVTISSQAIANKTVNYNEAPYIHTSLVDVTDKLPVRPPCRILFKNEWEQPSGSFKLRGIGYLIQQSILQILQKQSSVATTKKDIQVFASSGGNAGLAAAYTAFFYNLKCTVVLPTTSKKVVQDKLRGWGAELVLHGRNINEADKHLKTMLAQIQREGNIEPIYCHPFDNPLIWEGHSSLVDELISKVDDTSKIKGIVCSCGGGGLYNGIHEGLMRSDSIINSKVLLLETQQAPTLYDSLQAQQVITLPSNKVNSLATSLACSNTTNQTLINYASHDKVVTELELIDDLDAIKSCVSYYNQFNTVVEPACGTALSVVYNKIEYLYKHFGELSRDDVVIIVVCGGSCSVEADINVYDKMVKRSEIKL
ncbi:tryptophan synthase beta subunit-like PLP-dependent enzyme [Scheffersomyces amazonensis]|uniref:tryptophan synthase beta subunit-like PLP-dependent enzyme n=1 Tax=Scheffersomyces amazonensis TaxID=1078765 RepID=UPI00315DE638